MLSKTGKKYLIKLVMVPFLVLNGVFPGKLSLEIDYSAITALLESQSAILSYSSLAVVPLQIVQELFQKENSKTGSPEGSKKEEKKNTAASCDLIVLDSIKTFKKGAGFKNSAQKLPKQLINHVFSRWRENPYIRHIDKNFAHPEIILLLLLCILFLPRGSISDFVKYFGLKFKNTINENIDRVFFIEGIKNTSVLGNFINKINELKRGQNV